MRYILLLLLLIPAACARPVYISDDELEAKHFSYLKDKITTREDMANPSGYLKMGEFILTGL